MLVLPDILKVIFLFKVYTNILKNNFQIDVLETRFYRALGVVGPDLEVLVHLCNVRIEDKFQHRFFARILIQIIDIMF